MNVNASTTTCADTPTAVFSLAMAQAVLR